MSRIDLVFFTRWGGFDFDTARERPVWFEQVKLCLATVEEFTEDLGESCG
jgi:hypothetical protein